MGKTILANVSNSFFVRNILRTDASRAPRAHGGIRLVLLAPAAKVSYYRHEFPDNYIVFDALPPVRSRLRERFWKWLEVSSIATRTTFMMQMGEFFRPGPRTGVVRRALMLAAHRGIAFLGRFRRWRRFLRSAYAAFPNPAFDAILDRYRPDVVFCPSMIYMEDYVLAKAAKKRRIPVVGMTLAWDNLYSKTLLLVPPDHLIVHTDFIARQAISAADYPEERIAVTGIPQYDGHFLKRRTRSREEFFADLGGDPKKKLIVYALSGKQGLDLDFDILRILARIRREGKISAPVEVLVRPYPRYDFPPRKLEEIRSEYGFLVHSSVAHVGGARDDWEFDEPALALLSDTLAHADIIINVYSTFLIEGAIWDRPLIAPAFDGDLARSYWTSARRFFDWNHLSDIKRLGGIRLVKSEAELADAINRCLADPAYLREGRRRIVAQQCQFTDGKSGERVGKMLMKMVSS